MELEIQNTNLKDVSQVLKKLISDFGADTFIGSMPTTRGIYIQLFSQRLNRDYSLMVSGNEMSQVLAKVYEVLAGVKPVGAKV